MIHYLFAMIIDGTLLLYWSANYHNLIKPKFKLQNRLAPARTK